MLRASLLAFLVAKLFSLYPCVLAESTDDNLFRDEQCKTAVPEKADAALIQRNYRTGMTAGASDAAPHTDDAALLAIARDGDMFSFSTEQIARLEREAEEMSQRLETRRMLLEKVRAMPPQAKPTRGSRADVPDHSNEGLDHHGRPVGRRDEAPVDRDADLQDKILQKIVPVPYYMHHRDSPSRMHEIPTRIKHVFTDWYGDIIGDALDPTPHTEEEAQKHDAHSKGHVVILFLFGSLILGSILQMVLDRFCPAVPYTCGLFLVGALISLIHWFNQNYSYGLQWNTWFVSVDMWLDINPHLLFYVFLPALLMGDVMRLKVQLVAACSGQIFLLACPGVLMGTCLIAAFGKYCLPYGWDWPICLVFGSILSATDPVAVVSLFNTLGVSPRLTMLISGESLVNDGTAIVCFTLALKLAQGASLDVAHVTYWFLYMIIPAIIIGCCIGLASIAMIGLLSNVVGHADGMIQVVITVSCGYLAFFIAENEFSSSGVIATVTAGLTVAREAWPLFVSRETVHIVWEAIEFVGNTVIFFLAGVIFTGLVLSRDRHFGVQDFCWLLTLYVGMFLIRAIMMSALWLPLNMAGQHISWQEGIAMVWSGLRGAVSLAMGMIVDIEPGIDSRVGSQVMFHVGGIAALTLIINSVTSGPLLRILGLVKTESEMSRVSAKLSTIILEKVRHTYQKELKNEKDERFYGASGDLVYEMVPMLQPQDPPDITPTEAYSNIPEGPHRHHNHLKFLNEQISVEWKLVQVFREVFLRVVHSRYWQGIHDGVMPSQLNASRVLLHSTDKAQESTRESLKDWDIIARALNINSSEAPTSSEQFLSKLVDLWPFRLIPQFQKASIDFHTMMTVFVALSYIEAHTFAHAEIASCLGRDDAVGIRVRNQVIHESTMQRQKAVDFVSRLPRDFVELAKSQMLARRLLRQYIKEIDHKKEAGFLTEPEADHLSEPGMAALRELSSLPINIWQERLPSRKKDEDGSPETLVRDGSAVPIVDAMHPGFQLPPGTEGASHRGTSSPPRMVSGAEVRVASPVVPHGGLSQAASHPVVPRVAMATYQRDDNQQGTYFRPS